MQRRPREARRRWRPETTRWCRRLFMAGIVIVANLVADILYAYLAARIVALD